MYQNPFRKTRMRFSGKGLRGFIPLWGLGGNAPNILNIQKRKE